MRHTTAHNNGTLRQIINLEDLCVDSNSNTLYIVMELMECDLERLLASGHILTAGHVKVLLKQLLLGVQAVHRHGILRESATLQYVFTQFVFIPVRSPYTLS